MRRPGQSCRPDEHHCRPITQPWLKHAAQQWAAQALTGMTSGPVRAVIAAVGLFSEHVGPRADAGADPAEPTNVTAGGHSCPFRHRCTGCTYFRTDPSYTPEPGAYPAQLLTDSERLATAIPALADWARADATPSDEAIDAVRRLLRANDEVLTALDDEDRAAVEEAITAIRTQRATLDTTFPTELRGLTGPQPAVFFPTIERRAAASGSGHG
jgi:hypothetical protein